MSPRSMDTLAKRRMIVYIIDVTKPNMMSSGELYMGDAMDYCLEVWIGAFCDTWLGTPNTTNAHGGRSSI